MGSRRAKRVHGRLAVTRSKTLKTSQVIKKSQRAQQKADILAKARHARLAERQKPPPLVAIISLSGADSAELAKVSEIMKTHASRSIETIAIPKCNSAQYSFRNLLFTALDAAKVADMLVLVFKDEEEISDDMLEVLNALRSQGLPTLFSICIGNQSDDPGLRKLRGLQLDAHSLGDSTLLRPLPLFLDDLHANKNKAALRKMFAKPTRSATWRTRYGYMQVTSVQNVGGKVALGGYVRGAGLSANELCQVTGHGAFIVDRIVGRDGNVLNRRDHNGEDIASVGEIDDTMNEQTWPPEVDMPPDMMMEEEENDEDEKLAEEFDKVADRDDDERNLGMGRSVDAIDDDDEADMLDDDGAEADREMDEKKMEELKAARIDAEFPDEVDTPIDQAARTRFARYRGLKSFRTSLWDANEQLPRDYAPLFQFRNLEATRKRVLTERKKAAKNGGIVEEGPFVQVILQNVKVDLAQEWEKTVDQGGILVLSGMLRHENRRSVVHFGMTRTEGGGTVKAKTDVEMQCGFVRWTGRAMYSENNSNCEKHKMERFFVHGRHTVVSMYGPALYTSSPAILFRREGGLLATGSAMGADPSRIILKRIILTGYPFKTQKKRAVCRLMFFNPDDIRWFRPVELWTKLGRRGHIVEPLGMSGSFKCVFDGIVQHHDTICLTLYKRVYPKMSSEKQLKEDK